jgi:hypothetical protein
MPKKTTADKLLELHRHQNTIVDDAVGELTEWLRMATLGAVSRTQEWLAGRLSIVEGLIGPTTHNKATLRLLMRMTMNEMKRAKIDARLEQWSDTFARQMPLFDDVLALMDLPKMDWGKRDLDWLANSKLSAQDQVRGVVEAAARGVQEQVLMQHGALKLSDLYATFQNRMAMAPAAAANVADTSSTIFLRSVHERGYARIEATQGTPLRFRFYGPDDKLERPFCHALHQGKAISRAQGKRKLFAPASTSPDRSYTRAEIARMDNGQLPNVMLTGGGYRCRHQWVVASLAPAPADPAADTRTGEQVREQLGQVDKTAEARIAQLTREMDSTSRQMIAIADKPGPLPPDEAAQVARLETVFAEMLAERSKAMLEKARSLRAQLFAPVPGRVKVSLSSAAPDGLRRSVAEAEEFLGGVFGRDLGQVKATFRANARAHYKIGRNEMLLDRSETASTVIHEAGHWLEDQSEAVHNAAIAFLVRRTTGPDGKPETPRSLKSLTGKSYRSNEIARPDKFDHPYVGKLYPSRNGKPVATEVVSMGLQSMYDDPVRFSTNDPDYFDAVWAMIQLGRQQ